MIDQDVSYGIVTLSGSGAAVQSLRSTCASGASSSAGMETPEGIVYCGGGGVKRVIEYAIVGQSGEQWNAEVTVNGDTIRAIESPRKSRRVFSLSHAALADSSHWS